MHFSETQSSKATIKIQVSWQHWHHICKHLQERRERDEKHKDCDTHTHTHQTTFQQCLPLPAWQTLAEGMCSCSTALLTVCSPVIPEWWESSTSSGGSSIKTSVRGRVPEGQPPPGSTIDWEACHTGSHHWLRTMIWQTEVWANERGTVFPCGSSRTGLKTHWERIKLCRISSPNHRVQRSNDAVIFPPGSWEASLTVQLNFQSFLAALFSFPFVSQFWSYSNCEQPAIRAMLEQTEAKGQQCALTASTEKQIHWKRGHANRAAFYRTEQQHYMTPWT